MGTGYRSPVQTRSPWPAMLTALGNQGPQARAGKPTPPCETTCPFDPDRIATSAMNLTMATGSAAAGSRGARPGGTRLLRPTDGGGLAARPDEGIVGAKQTRDCRQRCCRCPWGAARRGAPPLPGGQRGKGVRNRRGRHRAGRASALLPVFLGRASSGGRARRGRRQGQAGSGEAAMAVARIDGWIGGREQW